METSQSQKQSRLHAAHTDLKQLDNYAVPQSSLDSFADNVFTSKETPTCKCISLRTLKTFSKRQWRRRGPESHLRSFHDPIRRHEILLTSIMGVSPDCGARMAQSRKHESLGNSARVAWPRLAVPKVVVARLFRPTTVDASNCHYIFLMNLGDYPWLVFRPWLAPGMTMAEFLYPITAANSSNMLRRCLWKDYRRAWRTNTSTIR